jgi:uroporphyrin-III C-methyltransferase/precorrin-2 dehydrogenase/sirohydrochlorin ferrochelatase
MDEPSPHPGSEIYLAGLLLAGRRVVVVGGGSVAVRRVLHLLGAGADVVVVAPDLSLSLRELVDAGRLRWQGRRYLAGDLDGAWYVVAATDDPAVNSEVAAEAERSRVFCVRADSGREGTSTTPAAGSAAGLRIGVVSEGDADPRRAAEARDALLDALRSGRLHLPPARRLPDPAADPAEPSGQAELSGPAQPSGPGTGA